MPFELCVVNKQEHNISADDAAAIEKELKKFVQVHP